MAISIAIPFYDAEEFLLDAIRSVFAQTFQDWELILIDDGSTDGSLELARSIKDPRVKVISDGENKRLAARLNEVAKIAKYDIIARMDADDLMLPKRIETQFEILKNNPELDIVTTGVFSVANNLSLKGARGESFENPSFRDIITKKVNVIHAAMLVKKSWYQRNCYDESLKIAQDYDLWVRSALKEDFKIKSIKDSLYIYREEGNVSLDKLLRAYKNERKMLFRYISPLSLFLIFKSYLKTIYVIYKNKRGGLHELLKRRNKTEIDLKQRELYSEALKEIKLTRIPGLDN
ncbi:glycosyltransferase family 2 protein [Robertkochia flava]|uniref:glycosyltransferase family 2 protein n=1 Tax=Robertkochia flava TaxID=3447986 RepID=UPI001CC9C0A1|nr:glycosyltransferase [Robertkochia marina]